MALEKFTSLETLENRAELLHETGYTVQEVGSTPHGVMAYQATKDQECIILEWEMFGRRLDVETHEVETASAFLDILEFRLDGHIEPWSGKDGKIGFVDFVRAEAERKSLLYCVELDKMRSDPDNVKRLTGFLSKLRPKFDS
jgi:RecB family endonuclease NucS